MKLRNLCLVALFLVVLAPGGWPTLAAVEYGGVGIFVYDSDRGYAPLTP